MKTENTIDHAEYFRKYGVQFGERITFTVDDYDCTIYYDEFAENATRRDIYSPNRYEFKDLAELVRCVENFDPLWMVVEAVYDRLVAETGKRLPDDPDFIESPEAILDAGRLFGSAKFLREVKADLEEWLSDQPHTDCEESDYEMPNPVSSAYNFFSGDPVCDDLEIEIVEGDCPGSSYFAARLMIDVEEANERCIKQNLPYEFV